MIGAISEAKGIPKAAPAAATAKPNRHQATTPAPRRCRAPLAGNFIWKTDRLEMSGCPRISQDKICRLGYPRITQHKLDGND